MKQILNLIIKPAFAQNPIGSLEAPASIVTSETQITSFFTVIVGLLTAVAGLWFFFNILLGGINYLSGAGDPKKTGEATKKITDSIIGLVIVAGAFIIASIVGSLLLGINILRPEIQTIGQ